VQTIYEIVPLHAPPFVSSESIFVILARVINRADGHLLLFDIRMLGFVHLLALLGAIYLLLQDVTVDTPRISTRFILNRLLIYLE